MDPRIVEGLRKLEIITYLDLHPKMPQILKKDYILVSGLDFYTSETKTSAFATEV